MRPQALFGRIMGHIPVPAALHKAAQGAASQFWTRQVESGFSEQVETMLPPRGLGRLNWIPSSALAAAGLRAQNQNEWVLTADVDPHRDCAWGTTLLWVLLNPGLVFKQRGCVPCVPSPGDWLLFDDFAEHSVEPGQATPDDGVFLAWSVKLSEHGYRKDRGAGELPSASTP